MLVTLVHVRERRRGRSKVEMTVRQEIDLFLGEVDAVLTDIPALLQSSLVEVYFQLSGC